jgi:tripartite-type tricarboxylate transporter receptor subunit TctC
MRMRSIVLRERIRARPRIDGHVSGYHPARIPNRKEGQMHHRIVVAFVCLLATLAGSAHAQTTWPARPIRILVPFPAGGQLDVVVRLIADKIGPALGQPIVVESKTGADGNIAAELVAHITPDGYTLLSTSVPFATQPTINPSTTRYDPLRDFEPIANLGTSSFVLVVPESVPASNLGEFIAYAKRQPGKLSYGGTSRGSVTHLSTEMFDKAAGISMEMIPYAGIPPALTDLLGDRTQFMSLGIIAAMPHIKSGKLRPLAVLDAQRNKLLPDVPSIVEAGFPTLTVGTWFGLLAPAGTPREIVQRINVEVMKALASDDILAKYQTIGVDAVPPHSPEQFRAMLQGEVTRWAKVVRDANIAPQ